jgi:hypothetical protein
MLLLLFSNMGQTVQKYGADRSEFEWRDEPGYTHWLLEKQDEHLQITITIWHGQIDSQGKFTDKRIIISTTPLKFAIQVWDALRHLLGEHGEKGYQESWRYPFPLNEYRRLDQLIREAKRAAREARKGKAKQSV